MEQKLLSKADTAAKKIETDWGSLCWLAGRDFGNSDDMTVGRVIIKAGMSNPPHRHPNCDEVLYLLQGTLEHTLDDETVIVNAGDTLSIRKHVFHRAKNIGDCDADLIVVFSSADRKAEGE